MTYLGINLAKKVKDLYSENYQILMMEFENDTRKWRCMPCSWIGRINIVKMSVPPKAIYWFNSFSIKIPKTFFTELEQMILKLIGTTTDAELPKNFWKKRTKLKISCFFSIFILNPHWKHKDFFFFLTANLTKLAHT